MTTGDNRARLRRAAGACLFLAVAACSTATTPDVETSGLYTFTIRNTGTQDLKQVRIQTGENLAPVLVASLPPGSETGTFGVAKLHENPFVTAEVNGVTKEFHPVEGFSGFNPLLSPGRYRISLKFEPAYGIVDTRVEPVP
jgi:hypothetical protein